jgi:hypothetical protein
MTPNRMDLTELLLILLGLAITAGGGVMLLRGAGRDASGVPRPYIPLGVMAAGLVIAYHTYSDYRTMDGLEVVGLFVFGLAFTAALLIRLFVTDRYDFDAASDRREPHEPTQSSDSPDTEVEAGGSGS